MTREQVEAILGGPPRWEVQPRYRRDELIIRAFNGGKRNQWWGVHGVIEVFYDRDTRVSWKKYSKLPFEPEPVRYWERLWPWNKKARPFE